MCLLTDKLVVATSSIQIQIFKSRFLISAYAHTISIIQLVTSEPHCSGPEIISQLSRQNLSTIEEGWTRVGSFIGDCLIFSAMEVSILEWRCYNNHLFYIQIM